MEQIQEKNPNILQIKPQKTSLKNTKNHTTEVSLRFQEKPQRKK